MAPVYWRDQSKKAKAFRDASLAKVEPPLAALPTPLPVNSQALPKQHLTAREYDLTQNYDAIQLLAQLRSKTLTSEELTRAFLRRAALAQHALNCVTELLWDEALARARHLDALPSPAGPLHGLPVSIKQQHGMRGRANHASYAAWVDEPSWPSALNDALWDAGAVFYVRTTEPQSTMQLETDNNITGKTVNPWNRALTCGGSSGGEGALLGFGASVLGMGGDIGGSVRVPAANNGVYGFKPTTRLLPLGGMKCATLGMETVIPTYGPLARSRETINLFMDVMLKSDLWRYDPSVVPRKWTPFEFGGGQSKKPLKVAVLWHDGVVKPHPPTTRALREVAEACKKAGMTVVDWVPLEHDKAWDIVSRLYWPDGGEETRKVLAESGEPALPLTEWIMTQPGVKKLSMQELWKVSK